MGRLKPSILKGDFRTINVSLQTPDKPEKNIVQ